MRVFVAEANRQIDFQLYGLLNFLVIRDLNVVAVGIHVERALAVRDMVSDVLRDQLGERISVRAHRVGSGDRQIHDAPGRKPIRIPVLNT